MAIEFEEDGYPIATARFGKGSSRTANKHELKVRAALRVKAAEEEQKRLKTFHQQKLLEKQQKEREEQDA